MQYQLLQESFHEVEDWTNGGNKLVFDDDADDTDDALPMGDKEPSPEFLERIKRGPTFVCQRSAALADGSSLFLTLTVVRTISKLWSTTQTQPSALCIALSKGHTPFSLFAEMEALQYSAIILAGSAARRINVLHYHWLVSLSWNTAKKS